MQQTATTKLVRQRKPELKNGKLKRTGRPYFIAWYWNGSNWSYKEFDIRKDATEYLKQWER